LAFDRIMTKTILLAAVLQGVDPAANADACFANRWPVRKIPGSAVTVIEDGQFRALTRPTAWLMSRTTDASDLAAAG
jgi:hypothetical protein